VTIAVHCRQFDNPGEAPTVRHTFHASPGPSDRPAHPRGHPSDTRERVDAVVSRKTARRLTATATATGAGGTLFFGLSRVAPQSLAILGATVVVAMVVLAFTGYKMLALLLQHLEPLTQVLSSRASQEQEGPG
jgi:hypothetical protein